MKIKLYNTESREQEEIVPQKKGELSLYTCGPTVYDFAHIGNFRTYVFEDLLRRTLEHSGLKVKHVMNITDIDDKTIAGALHEKQSIEEYTAPYIKAFFEDLETLGIEKAHHYPHATDFIPQMIDLIQILLDKKMAYRGADESIYYSIRHFPKYGRLSHLKLDELKAGASERVGTDEYDKENVADFVLWKAYDPKRDGPLFWESPFGKGRPGWHIECSAMAMNLLGETIDLHVGGVDNMFPHHENEIAQSESCTGKTFVRHWLHSEHLLVEHKKMSKSLGNFYTLRDLLAKGYTGQELRFLLLSSHYRTQLNFTFEGLDAARKSLSRLADFVYRLQNIQDEGLEESAPILSDTLDAFNAALSDDLNISVALAALFELVRKINKLADEKRLSKEGAQKTLELLKQLDTVLNVIPFEGEAEVPNELLEALALRQEARAAKNWEEADKQRDLIQSAGYLIEDTSSGPKLKKK